MVYTPISAFAAGVLMTGAAMNTYVRDNLNALYASGAGGVVPTLAICWWPTDVSTRPSNWFACDGTFGVVDLRDRFIVGAGSTYAVHDVGGSATAAQAAHTAHSISAPDHAAHTVTGASPHGIVGGLAQFAPGASSALMTSDSHSATLTSEVLAHASQALSDTHAHVGSPFDIRPPFKALTPILKGTPTVAMPTPRTWADGDVPTAAMFNQDFRDAFNALRQRMLYVNSIIVWSGSLAALPSGYQICDGTNGTIDMRDYFDMSAGLSFAAGAAAGAASLTVPAHNNHVPTQAAAHANHAAILDAAHSFAVHVESAGSDQGRWDGVHAVTINGAHGNHSGFAVDAHVAHDPITTIPPYIALGYIQLTSAGTFTLPRTWTDGELVDQSRLNTYVRDNESALYAGQVPIGGILAWHESIASIPANYAHVNGSGGRYDTRDRFIAGAGLTYAVGGTGGATSSTPAAHAAHVVTSPNTHSNHGSVSAPAHVATSNTFIPGPPPTVTFFTGSFAHNYSLSGGGAAQHAHVWTVDGGAAHSSHSSMSILPAYHSLAFIQRTS